MSTKDDKQSDKRFERTELLFGKKAIQKLAQSCVTIAGLGAVGSYAVEALARCGIGKLHLIDFDTIHVSNINRQLYAMDSTIGKPKTMIAAQRIKDINPDCKVLTSNIFIDRNSAKCVLNPRPDVLVDAIDSVGPKATLLETAHQAELTIVSCMGAAVTTNPDVIRTADIADTRFCPLARGIRRYLKRRGINNGILCIYSEEDTRAIRQQLPPADPTQWKTRGRARQTLGSFSCMTGIFGLRAAREVIRLLLGKDFPA